MAEKEKYEAAHEALREVTDHPERESFEAERLLRFLQGAAYHDKQAEADERREEPTEHGRP